MESAVSGPVPLKNVAAFMAMTTRLIERGPHLPGFAVCHGAPGYGKSLASISAQNRTGTVRVEVGGFEVEVLGPVASAADAGALAASAPIVCVCATDDDTEAVVGALAPGLREAGARAVVVAGAPREGLGADAFVHRKMNAVETLERLVAKLEEDA